MATVEEGLQALIRNIEAQYGKSLDEWMTLVKASGRTKHSEIMAMLKTDYGMTHGSANRIALIARGADAASIAKDAAARNSDPVTELYGGAKAVLKPIHDRIMAIITSFGDDIEVAPKKGYVSIRRKKQFCMIQPTTASRIDVGIILKETEPTGKLELSGSFNTMFSHRVRVSSPEDASNDLANWLKRAYEQAG